METEQLMILLRAILPSRPPTPPVFSPGVNVVLTARARAMDPQAPDVLNEDNPPSPGDIDVKGTEDPLPFDGSPSDARPFIERVEAWFALLPCSYRLTRTRIIATCQIITISPAEAWARQMSRAVYMIQDSPEYCDNWEEFCALFITSFGIPNEREDAYNRLAELCQDNWDLSVYLAEFNRLRTLAEVSEDVAIHELRRGLSQDLFWAISGMIPPPTTLNEWYSAARMRDLQLQES